MIVCCLRRDKVLWIVKLTVGLPKGIPESMHGFVSWRAFLRRES